MKKIYLDYNATSPLRTKARTALIDALEEFGNPSSIHGFGRLIKNKILLAKEKIADLLNIAPNRIVFTSGATESNNTAILSIPGAKVFVSPLEHASVMHAVSFPLLLKVYSSGLIDLVSLENDLSSSFPRKIVSISLAHNETGIIQDLKSIIQIAKKYHAFVHTDATQALSRIPLSPEIFEAHLVTFSSHKVGGPMGLGLLILPENQFFTPLIHGGGQQKGMRGGSENYPAIISFAAALEEALDELKMEKWNKIETLREYLEHEILKISPESIVVGGGTDRLPNTSSFSMPGVDSLTQVVAFDLEGIAVSAGSSCSSGTVKLSEGVKAMGIPENHLKSLLRVSLGITTTKDEIDKFLEIWSKIYKNKQN